MSQLETPVAPWEPNIHNPYEKVLSQLQTPNAQWEPNILNPHEKVLSQLQTNVVPWEPKIFNPHEKVKPKLQTFHDNIGNQRCSIHMRNNVAITNHPWHLEIQQGKFKSQNRDLTRFVSLSLIGPPIGQHSFAYKAANSADQ